MLNIYYTVNPVYKGQLMEPEKCVLYRQ